MAKAKGTEAEIYVVREEKGELTLGVLSEAPMLFNRMAEKAKRELLYPRGRRNAADRASTMKHDPLGEFRASAKQLVAPDEPTLLAIPSSAFHLAMCTAALDTPGTNKSQIGRLTWVEGEWARIYGMPMMKMDIVRSADINHTPDVRTRAIVPEWATVITVTFVRPNLIEQPVFQLLANAGLHIGVGDWRQGKGNGSYGRFRLVAPDDPDLLRIMKSGGRAAQIEGMEAAKPYDEETEELYAWYTDEVQRRRGTQKAAKV